MGIKNKKEKAIFKKEKSKPLKTNSSLSYKFAKRKIIEDKEKKKESKVRELRNKPIKLSKDFIDFKDTNDLAWNLIPNKNIVGSNNLNESILVSNHVNKSQKKLISKKTNNKGLDIGAKISNKLRKETLIKSISKPPKVHKVSSSNPRLNHHKNHSQNILVEETEDDSPNRQNLKSKEKNILLESLKKEKVLDIKEKTKNSKGSNIIVAGFQSNIKGKIETGSETEDIGIKSISDLKTNQENIQLISSRLITKRKDLINSRVQREFKTRDIKTKSNPKDFGKNRLIKAKRKEAIIKDIQTNKRKESIYKTSIDKLRAKIFQFKELGFSKLLIAFPLFFLLLMTLLVVGNGNVSTSPSFIILTTDEQNEAFLDYYEELKTDLEDEIKNLIANSTHDDVVVYGLGPNNKLYDLDFTEWLAILAVKIEQDFKLSSFEYSYSKEIFQKMIYYETHVNRTTTKDSDGNRETRTTLVITVNNKSYFDIKDSLGFTDEDLEWTERLIEYDSLKDRIENMPTNASYIVSSGSLSPEEIEKYGGQMVHPLNSLGRISSPYGCRIHPIDKVRKFHSGIDLAIGAGTPIYASQDGRVIHSGDRGGYGKTIIIDHGNGLTSLYAHCSALVAKPGPIKKGDHIANVGTTGNSTGNHLHFEVRVNGSTVNPLNFINH